jgi:hypothetical protein
MTSLYYMIINVYRRLTFIYCTDGHLTLPMLFAQSKHVTRPLILSTNTVPTIRSSCDSQPARKSFGAERTALHSIRNTHGH